MAMLTCPKTWLLKSVSSADLSKTLLMQRAATMARHTVGRSHMMCLKIKGWACPTGEAAANKGTAVIKLHKNLVADRHQCEFWTAVFSLL